MTETPGPPATGPRTAGAGVSGVVVTFDPDDALLKEVVRAAALQLEGLILLDNGSSTAGVEVVREAVAAAESDPARRARIFVRFGDRNLGLPPRFNEAIEIARHEGFGFLLFLDQDSVVLTGASRALQSAFPPAASRVPLGALEAINDEPARLPTDDFLEDHFRRHTPPQVAPLVDDFLVTNSGLFVPLATFDRVGGFDETFFLDATDFEFGLRLWARGLRVLRVPDARIRHRRGDLAEVTVAGSRWRLRRVAPFRHYYVARDTLRTLVRYGWRHPLVGLYLLSIPFREAVLVVLFYPRRGPHLRALVRGLGDWAGGVTGARAFPDSER